MTRVELLEAIEITGNQIDFCNSVLQESVGVAAIFEAGTKAHERAVKTFNLWVERAKEDVAYYSSLQKTLKKCRK